MHLITTAKQTDHNAHRIDICGGTYERREALKALGCKWDANRQEWSLETDDGADDAEAAHNMARALKAISEIDPEAVFANRKIANLKNVMALAAE